MTYEYTNKIRNIRTMNNYMFAKSLGMFDYSGLPESIPESVLEDMLQKTGYAFICKHNNELYAFTGNLTGKEKDVYGRPTEIIINNTGLDFNETVKISDGVLIKNDDYMLGLSDVFEKYNTMLSENEISMMLNTVNNRIQNILSAGDDKTKASAEEFIKNVGKGHLGIIGESQILEGLKIHNAQSNNSTSVINLIEFQQYIKATMYNEIGIDLNFNMKRERLTSGEVAQNTEMLFPLVNQMFLNRSNGVDELNEKFGLNVEVEYGSIWKQRESTDETPIIDEPIETDETPETDETDEEEEENE